MTVSLTNDYSPHFQEHSQMGQLFRLFSKRTRELNPDPKPGGKEGKLQKNVCCGN